MLSRGNIFDNKKDDDGKIFCNRECDAAKHIWTSGLFKIHEELKKQCFEGIE